MPKWLRQTALMVGFWLAIIYAAELVDSFRWSQLSIQVCEEPSAHEQLGENCQKHPQTFGETFLFWLGSVTAEQIIALFTIVLGVATIRLWQSTDKLWEAGERTIAGTTKANRAYVFMGLQRTVNHQDTGVREGVLQLNNVGLSMAIVGRVFGQFVASVPTSEIPSFDAPTEANSVFLDFAIPANSPAIAIEIFRPKIPEGFGAPFFLIGYVEYIDIYQARHTSYYCCQMDLLNVSGPAGGPGGKILPVGPEAWNSWT